MKRLFNILPCLLLLSILYPSLCLSNPCSQALIRAMKEEGLTEQQIDLICKKAELYQETSPTEPLDPYTKACVNIAKRESNEMLRDGTISEAKKAYETALNKINKESLKTKTQAKLTALN